MANAINNRARDFTPGGQIDAALQGKVDAGTPGTKFYVGPTPPEPVDGETQVYIDPDAGEPLAYDTPAGGDLSGVYPDPALANTGVEAGTYGSSTLIPVLTIDAKGRVTAAETAEAAGGGGGGGIGFLDGGNATSTFDGGIVDGGNA